MSAASNRSGSHRRVRSFMNSDFQELLNRQLPFNPMPLQNDLNNYTQEAQQPEKSHHRRNQEVKYPQKLINGQPTMKKQDSFSQESNSNVQLTQQKNCLQQDKNKQMNSTNKIFRTQKPNSNITLKGKSLFIKQQIKQFESPQQNKLNSKVQKVKGSSVSTAASSLNPLLSKTQNPFLHEDLQLQEKQSSPQDENNNLNYMYALQSVKDFQQNTVHSNCQQEQVEEKELEQQILKLLQSAKNRLNININNQGSILKPKVLDSIQGNFPQKPLESKWLLEKMISPKKTEEQNTKELTQRINQVTQQQNDNKKSPINLQSERLNKSLQNRSIRKQSNIINSPNLAPLSVSGSRNGNVQKSLTTSLVINSKVPGKNNSKLRQQQVMNIIKNSLQVPPQKQNTSSKHSKKTSIYKQNLLHTIDFKQ